MNKESSDEEEDREKLIEANDTKIQRSAFEIGQFRSKIRQNLRIRKRYLCMIVVPIILIVIYFSFDLRDLLKRSSNLTVDNSLNDPVRESELRALYLLRNQQLGLVRLWNHTQGYAREYSERKSNLTSLTSANSTKPFDVSEIRLSSVALEDLRSALLEQIKINRQIQDVLLYPHRVGNQSEILDDFGGYVVNTCHKSDLSEGKKRIEWKPRKNRYLFAICLSGQMSNHLICLQKHMFFAALLDRTLVIPSSKIDYQYDQVLNIDRINNCLGRNVVISFHEFSHIKKNQLHIDRFICYASLPPCFLDEEHIRRLKSLGLSLGKIEAAWPEDAKLKEPKERFAEDIVPKFSCNDEVLAIGDMFYANVEEKWVMQPGGPLVHKCKALLEPNKLIILTAQRFIQTFLGKNFVALHFRRHGFLQFCNAKKESCFFPIPQAAECIIRVAERANAPVIYLSTDADESEINLLRELTVLNGKKVPLVTRPSHTSSEKWDALLYRKGINEDSQVVAMLDKTISALSTVFVGSSGSTFTEDIIRLRKDWGIASVCDEYLCQGELPNFQASHD